MVERAILLTTLCLEMDVSPIVFSTDISHLRSRPCPCKPRVHFGATGRQVRDASQYNL